MLTEEKCPQCGYVTRRRRNPTLAVDIIIEYQDRGLVLIERANAPHGWALPGGFVDYGESLEAAAVREAREETGLTVTLLGQFHTYSDPGAIPGNTRSPPCTWPRALATPGPPTTPGAWRSLPRTNCPRCWPLTTV